MEMLMPAAIAGVMMVIDIVTGFVAALASGTVSSTVMRQGLYHKAGSVVAIILAALLQYASGWVDLDGLSDIAPGLYTVTCAYIILFEALSVCENAVELNPELQTSKLAQLLGSKSDKDKGAEDDD